MLLREVYDEISKRLDRRFLEIDFEGDHFHFLNQSLPSYSPKSIVTKEKKVTTRRIFSSSPEVNSKLWVGEFWTDGSFGSMFSENSNEDLMHVYLQ